MCILIHVSDTSLRPCLFHGLADPSRLRILEALTDGSRRVSDIVEATGLSQPNASMHLACLFDCGLVDRERRGREVHYRLAAGVAPLLRAADALLDRAGDRISGCERYGAGRARAVA